MLHDLFTLNSKLLILILFNYYTYNIYYLDNMLKIEIINYKLFLFLFNLYLANP